jgi:hypothetical protein
VARDPLPAYFRGFQGSLWQFIDTRVRDAWRRGVGVLEACSPAGFGSRADSVQTVPAALYVLMSHADSFEAAVIAAVNDTKDNDTIASVVGAVLGALHGERGIRRRWIDGITSSSVGVKPDLDDRALIHRLTAEAVARFV